MQKKFQRNLIALAVASTLGGISTLASAAGFALIEQSASGMGNAFAGAAATAEDASTVFFNPAGMSQIQGKQIAVGGHLIDLSAKFSNSGSSKPAAIVTNPLGGNGGDAGGMAVIPNFYFVMPIGDRVNFGVGVNAPFGLMTEYDDNWAGRFQGIKSDLKAVNINPSISFKVNDSFSIGAGVNYQRLDVELTNAVVLGANTEGRAKLEADDTAWGWNAGVLFQPTSSTKIGASYRSKLDYTLDGTTTVTFLNGAPVTAVSGPTTADVTLPDSFSLSLAQKLNDEWEFLADATFTRWSKINRINIVNSTNGTLRDSLVLDFDDTWRYSIGVNYKLNDGWTLKGGLALDQTPVKGATTRSVRLPDNDRTWVSLGAAMKIMQNGRLDMGYSHLFIKDADINFTRSQQAPGFTTPTPAPGTASTVAGSYTGSVDIFSVQYSISF
ncbi:MAG: outer membrane protein transport protein [Betaproteobacteria bacterium]|nr:outer membrane protein transport protein [Betaproteobacteria bacterium]